MYGYTSSITRRMVLERFSQEEIFGWCLKDIVTTDRKYCSPLRDDRHPACYFRYDSNDVLWFCDWASLEVHYNCFQFYSKVFGVPYELVYTHIWNNVDDCAMYVSPFCSRRTYKNKKHTGKTVINVLEKDWEMNEIKYWQQYKVSVQQLESDNVKPLKAVLIQNGEESFSFRIDKIGFVYNFHDGRKKIYQPYNKAGKWYTNCNANDIGNIENLPENGYNLIITKSYKDCRVLRNLGWNTIWFQNEGMCPSADILEPLLKRFERVHVFYDNDKPGIIAAEKIKDMLLKHNNNIMTFHLPEKLFDKGIKDASDLVKSISYSKLNEFIKLKLEEK